MAVPTLDRNQTAPVATGGTLARGERQMRETRNEAALERALMEEYLSDQELSFEDLASFDEDDRERLTLEAAAYAAMRLGERAYR